ITGQKWKSVQFVKARTAPANPRTEKQQAHRAGFKYATRIGALFHKSLYTLYKCPLKGAQTTLNYFLLNNKGFINDPSGDLSKLCFTKGPLPGIQAMSVSVASSDPPPVEEAIPPMTSNTSPLGFAASASSTAGGERFHPYHAFDGILEQLPLDTGTDWCSAYQTPPFADSLTIKLPFTSVIDRFIFYGPRLTDRLNHCPSLVTFYGQNPGSPPVELASLSIPSVPEQYAQPYEVTPDEHPAFSSYTIRCSNRTTNRYLRIGQLKIFSRILNALRLDITPYVYGNASPHDSLIIGVVNLTQYTYSQLIAERQTASHGPIYIESAHQPGDTLIIFAALTDNAGTVSNNTKAVVVAP
ncbi:MAG: hypothetical protein LBH15_00885, partial [Treponema sp.]|nr:hypothetical protein [Treponema sp.]